MNLFYLDTDVTLCAKYHCDEHVKKMIIEYSQLLANCFTLEQLALTSCPRTQTGTSRKHSHWTHPTAIWTRASYGNFCYLITLAQKVCDEYESRKGRKHFTSLFIDWVSEYKELAKLNIPNEEITTEIPVAIAPGKQCRKVEGFDQMSLVDKYRTYYIYDKLFASWADPELIPEWFINGRRKANIPVAVPKNLQKTWWVTTLNTPHI